MTLDMRKLRIELNEKLKDAALTEEDLNARLPRGDNSSTFGLLKKWCDPSVSELFYNITKIGEHDAVAVTGMPFFAGERVPTDTCKLFIFTDFDGAIFDNWYEVKSNIVMAPGSTYLFDRLQDVIDDTTKRLGLRIRRYGAAIKGGGELDVPANFWNFNSPSDINYVFDSHYIGSTIYFEDETDAVAARVRLDADR